MRVQTLSKTHIEEAYERMLEPKADHRNKDKQIVISIETLRISARVLKLTLKEWGVGKGVIVKNPAVMAPQYLSPALPVCRVGMYS